MRILSLLLVVFMLVTTISLVACDNNDKGNNITTPNQTKPNDTTLRTTITEEEWNKTLEMNNYTSALEGPDFSLTYFSTKNSIRVEDPMGYDWYYVREDNCFYGVNKISDMWCRSTNPIDDPKYSTLSHFMSINISFSDLKYNEESKSYSVHCILENEEFDSEFIFLNGVLTHIKHSSPEWDFVATYTFTNIGTTVVEVPEYITTSCYYALQVMPNGGGFEELDISSYSLPSSIKEVHKATNGGYVFKVEFSAFYSGNVAYIGVDANGNVTGTLCIENHENMGRDYIENYDKNGFYINKNLGNIDSVDFVANCTMTTKGYRNAVKDALTAAQLLQ